jgi:chloramphenicol 3-O phosphotransferase
MPANSHPPGRIIVLNGASSAGKTSLLRALQQVLPEPYLEAGIDKFLWMLPGRYLDRPLWYQVITSHHPPGGELYFTSGGIGDRLVTGMHRAAAALAGAGNNILLDHVLIEPAWLADCVEQLAPFEPLFVGVTCPLAVLEARERGRNDRTLGQARAHHAVVHAHGIYDVEVDTSAAPPEACAAQITDWLASGARPSAFVRLRG